MKAWAEEYVVGFDGGKTQVAKCVCVLKLN